jgi:hypothetical protein
VSCAFPGSRRPFRRTLARAARIPRFPVSSFARPGFLCHHTAKLFERLPDLFAVSPPKLPEGNRRKPTKDSQENNQTPKRPGKLEILAGILKRLHAILNRQCEIKRGQSDRERQRKSRCLEQEETMANGNWLQGSSGDIQIGTATAGEISATLYPKRSGRSSAQNDVLTRPPELGGSAEMKHTYRRETSKQRSWKKQ